ncbi:MAG: cupin domain-containing protein [Nocardioidaceae bacterium]
MTGLAGRRPRPPVEDYVRRLPSPAGGDGQPLLDAETCLIREVDSRAGEASDFQAHPCDKLVWALEGDLTLETPGSSVVLRPGSAAWIRSGAAHRERGGDTAGRRLEILPRPPARGRDLRVPSSPPSGGAAVALKDVAEVAVREPVPGFQIRELFGWADGCADVSLRHARVRPPAGGIGWHIHPFDQVYFVLAGTLHVEIAQWTFDVDRDCLVFLPAGVPHRNWVVGDVVEEHLVLLLPAPSPGSAIDYFVDFALTGELLRAPQV